MEGCQNVSIEIWIRAAKFSEKNPIRYEDINKIQTEYPPSGKFPRSGMHRGEGMQTTNLCRLWTRMSINAFLGLESETKLVFVLVSLGQFCTAKSG